MSQRFLITGATGRVGSALAGLLAGRGESIRAGARRPASAMPVLPRSAEIADFDFDRPETFAPAVRGIDKMFLVARPGDNNADKAAIPLVDAAKKAGLQLIVHLTAMGVEQGNASSLRVLEQYIESSGIPFVHLRPNWFMQNFSSGPMATDLRTTGALHLPASDAKLSFIDARDVAAVALASLTEARHTGKAYTLTGGEALDHFQVVDLISRSSGRKFSYVPLTEEIAGAGLKNAGVADHLIERWTLFYRLVRQGFCAPVFDDVTTILGRGPIRFEQFVNDYAAVWK